MAQGPGSQSPKLRNAFSAVESFPKGWTACTLAASHPCTGGVTLGIKHHHHLVRSPPGAQRDEKVHVSFHSLVPGVQGTGIGGNQLDPKSLLPSALQRQPSYRLARARSTSTRQGSLCLLTTHLQMPPSNATPLQDFKAEQTRTGSVSSAL